MAKHIFQGPSAALEAPGYHRGRQGNAALMNITSLDAHNIAYVAVQTRFALTTTQAWTKQDACFNYEAFYWRIVDLFSDGECQDIIALFNHHVFGTTLNAVASADQDGNQVATNDESDFDQLKAQRAAKRARVQAQAASEGQGSGD